VTGDLVDNVVGGGGGFSNTPKIQSENGAIRVKSPPLVDALQ
jgi:hypothetical protein